MQSPADPGTTSGNRSTTRIAVAISAAAFGVLALLTSVQLHVARVVAAESGSFFRSLAFGTASWIVWALAAPVILALGRRFDFSPGRRALSIAVHTVCVLMCSVPASIMVTVAGMTLYGNGVTITRKVIVQTLVSSTRLQTAVLVYASILGIGYAARLWDRLRVRDVQAARLESQAAQARLQALGLRLQPHFLFNTLHTIGALVDEDPRMARRMIVNLGDLLRDVLAEADETEIPLRDELALLQRYLAIEQVRFADRLRVTVDADADTLNLLVPRLLLQPLVENAARHGIAPIAAGGQINITSRRVDGQLQLRVWNDGAPLAADHSEHTGLGTTRLRLVTRHGGTASLVVRAADGGVESLIVMPMVTRG